MMWTSPDIEMATRMWKEGSSAGEIAAVMPDKTRNAVIGLIYRLGMTRKPGTGRTGPRKPRTISQAIAAAPKDDPMVYDEPATVVGMTVSTARNGCCRWPMGNPSDGGDMPMCGHEIHTGSPYCPFHHAKAYTKPIKSKAKVKWANTWRAA